MFPKPHLKIAIPTAILFGVLFIVAFVSHNRSGHYEGSSDPENMRLPSADIVRQKKVEGRHRHSDSARQFHRQMCLFGLQDDAARGVSGVVRSLQVADECSLLPGYDNAIDPSSRRNAKLDKSAVGLGVINRGVRNTRLPVPTSRPLNAIKSRSNETGREAKCDHTNLVLKRGAYTLLPGIYCGGIVALNSSKIKLEPGVYTIRDGPFYLGGKSSMNGSGVNLVFIGRNSVFVSGISTKLSLTAARKGRLPGILFFRDEISVTDREFVIGSFDRQALEGMFYLPNSRLSIVLVEEDTVIPAKPSLIARQIEVRRSRHSDGAATGAEIPTNGSKSTRVIAFTQD